MTAPARTRRRAQLAAIHAARRELGLNEDSYRDLLERLTGARSAAARGPAALGAVLDHLKGLGWRPPVKPGGRLGKGKGRRAPVAGDQARLAAHRAAGAGPQEALILSLWDELEAAGAFRHGIHARLDTFMARLGGDCAVAHPRFLTPAAAQKVIEGLRAWLARVRAGAGGPGA